MDPDKYKAARFKPLQARGKERVRVILAAALELFREKGMERVTTNDIAKAARIPIGSLYRYYPNKDAIVSAITALYVDDISEIFEEIGKHPFLPHLSWDEILLLMIDAWVTYARLNGPYAFLYVEKANPRLHAQNRDIWQRFVANYGAVLKRRCPVISERDVLICFQLSLAGAELGINDEYQPALGAYPHHEVAGIVAAHLLRKCQAHLHEDILA